MLVAPAAPAYARPAELRLVAVRARAAAVVAGTVGGVVVFDCATASGVMIRLETHPPCGYGSCVDLKSIQYQSMPRGIAFETG
jgi:hypothetical protein